MVSVRQSDTVVVTVKDRVEHLHEGITDDEQVVLAFLADRQLLNGRLAGTIVVTELGALIPVACWQVVVNAINDKSQVGSVCQLIKAAAWVSRAPL
jgi:hypothetical protein